MVRRSLENHWITVIQTTVFWRAHCGYECTDGRPGICWGPELEGVFVLPTRVVEVEVIPFPVRVQDKGEDGKGKGGFIPG